MKAIKLFIYGIGTVIDKRIIKILTLGINGTFPFVYSSFSRTYSILEVNKILFVFIFIKPDLKSDLERKLDLVLDYCFRNT